MADLYPAIEPHAHGYLDVDDGHQMYWEAGDNSSIPPPIASCCSISAIAAAARLMPARQW
jgi:hypothetical protein